MIAYSVGETVMQIDMHYFGTYAMARAAGMSQDAAGIAATCAQYVDDNVQDTPIVLKDGARLARSPTAHHMGDLKRNNDLDDQRTVWVPFHFLPGNEVDEGATDDYTLRLRCRKNSEPANQMIDILIEQAPSDPFALERAGVTAHVYADTFSHFGFSGVASRRNQVDGDSFRFTGIEPQMEEALRGGAKAFFTKYGGQFANIKSWIAETVTNGLGHGSVATYPDLPYLEWSFNYEYPRRVREDRNNLENFVEACGALHSMFGRLVERRPDFVEGKPRPFADIKDTIAAILSVHGDRHARSAEWQKAAQAGDLFDRPEAIPAYQGDAWTAWLEGANHKVDSETGLDHPACRFHIAANAHRNWVLYTLLPSRNLLIA